jgi:hypothetical protein
MVECCIAAWPILAACHASQNRRVERGLNARADTGFLTMDERAPDGDRFRKIAGTAQ